MAQLDGKSHASRQWTVLVLLCLAQFMLIADITVVQVALPSIGRSLELGRDALAWVVTAYTLMFAGLMILGGRLADAFGARRTLLTGVALFTLASLACGLAGSGGALIAGRATQGIGGALMSPSALAILITTFKGAERRRALGIWSAIGGAGAAVGVLLGGLLTSGPGWSWVFFVNVPVGLALLCILPMVVVGQPRPGQRHSVDVPGALVATSATAFLIYGLVRAGDTGWTGAATLASLGVAAAGYLLFVFIEGRVRVPLVHPAILGRRPVQSGVFVMLFATGLMLGMFFLMSFYLQQVLGFSALKTGLMFVPFALSLGVGAHFGGRLLGLIGGRPVVTAAFVLAAAGAALLSRISVDGNAYVDVLPGTVIVGLGIGSAFVTAFSTTLANVSAGESGVVSGVINTFHELGGAIGVAIVSTLAAGSITAASAHAGAVADIGGFTRAFTYCAIAAIIAAPTALSLMPGGKPVGVVGHGH
jgi:EmrB/QacA subfamily drug resistance transporter